MKKNLDKNQLRFDYNVIIKRINNKTGQILDEEKIHNTIVNNGLNLVRDFLGDVAPDVPKYIAIGTDNTAVQNTDTALGTEYTRSVASGIDVATDYQVEFTKIFTFGSGVSETIVEAGLFDNATASGSTMLNRFVFSGKAVDSDTDLSVTITLTIARS